MFLSIAMSICTSQTVTSIGAVLFDEQPWEKVVPANQQQKKSEPCDAHENHQLDFWIGEWEVYDTADRNSPATASSVIQSFGCFLIENYAEGNQFSGKSINFYDPALHRWRQTWADSSGHVSEFSGELVDNVMRLTGESHLPGETVILRRMSLINESTSRVRQVSEASRDQGKTWRVNYDYTYMRIK